MLVPKFIAYVIERSGITERLRRPASRQTLSAFYINANLIVERAKITTACTNLKLGIIHTLADRQVQI